MSRRSSRLVLLGSEHRLQTNNRTTTNYARSLPIDLQHGDGNIDHRPTE